MKQDREEVEQVEEVESGTFQIRRPSQLFLVRLWVGDAGKGLEEWHGKVQHAVTGETHYFHNRLELTDTLRRMMPGTGDGRSESGL